MGRCARNARPRRNRKVLHQTNCALSHRHPGKQWKGRHGFKQAKILKLIPCVYVHPESYFLHRGIHESWDKDIFLIYICYMYPKYTFVCHSRHKPLSTVLLEIAYVRKKQNSTSQGMCNRWLVHGNCKVRQGCGFPWARKCGHGCLLVNDTTVIREMNFEDMIWYVFGLVPRTTSHWKIVGNESRSKGSMNICQWGPERESMALSTALLVLLCFACQSFDTAVSVWFLNISSAVSDMMLDGHILSCFESLFSINSQDEFRVVDFLDVFFAQDYIYGTPPPLTVSRSEEWLKGNKKPMQTGDSTSETVAMEIFGATSQFVHTTFVLSFWGFQEGIQVGNL